MSNILERVDLIWIGKIRKEYCPPERIKLRRQAEDLAIEIIDSTTPGSLNHDDVENILRLLNYDYWREKVHYSRFDQTFLGQNLNLILETDIEVLNNSFIELYWNENLEIADKFINEIGGAKFGFISSLLYLKNRKKFNILLSKLEKGVENLFPELPLPDKFILKYPEYNKLVNKLKEGFKIEPQEIDIILAVAANRRT